MRIQFLVSIATDTWSYRSRQVVDLPEATALEHIRVGHAVPVDEPAPPPAPPPEQKPEPEAASAAEAAVFEHDEESAIVPRARGRRRGHEGDA